MQISYTDAAFSSLSDWINYIELKNTLGAGVGWLNKLETLLQHSLQHPAVIKLCNNRTFHLLELRCLNFNDWIIAFSIATDNKILIEAVLHSSGLID